MLIVVEGVDRTGKTSLVEACAGRDDTVIHWDKPTSDSAGAEYIRPLLGYRPGAGRNMFCDRHYLGELVWPTIFGRESIVTPADQAVIEWYLAAMGALCVLAYRRPDKLEAACADEPCAGRAAEAQRMFVDLSRRSSLSWWRWVHGDDTGPLLEAARKSEAASAAAVESWR